MHAARAGAGRGHVGEGEAAEVGARVALGDLRGAGINHGLKLGVSMKADEFGEFGG